MEVRGLFGRHGVCLSGNDVADSLNQLHRKHLEVIIIQDAFVNLAAGGCVFRQVGEEAFRGRVDFPSRVGT